MARSKNRENASSSDEPEEVAGDTEASDLNEDYDAHAILEKVQVDLECLADRLDGLAVDSEKKWDGLEASINARRSPILTEIDKLRAELDSERAARILAHRTTAARLREVAQSNTREIAKSGERIPKQLQDKLDQLTARLDSEVTTHITNQIALRDTIESLKGANNQLQEKIKSDWNMPKVAFGTVTTLAILIFGVGISYQWLNALELGRRTQELKGLSEKYEGQLAAAKKSKSLGISADVAAHRIISLVSLGRDQLVNKHDPVVARYYAEEAEKLLTKTKNDLKSEDELDSVLDELWPPIFLLEADATIEMRDIAKLEKYVQEFQQNYPRCQEHFYYQGFVELWRLTTDFSDSATLRKAINSLTQSRRQQDHTAIVLLYLSAASFEAGQYTESEEHAWNLLQLFPEQYRARLPRELRALIVLATLWHDLAQAALGKTILFGHLPCGPNDLDALSVSDAILFERLLNQVVRKAPSIVEDDVYANSMAWPCVEALYLLQKASKANLCSNDFSEFRKSFNLRLRPEVPRLSEEKSLGKVIDGRLHLRYLEIITVNEMVESIIDGTPTARTVEVEQIQEHEAKEDPAQQIPTRRYLPFDWSPIEASTTETSEEIPMPMPRLRLRPSPVEEPVKAPATPASPMRGN